MCTNLFFFFLSTLRTHPFIISELPQGSWASAQGLLPGSQGRTHFLEGIDLLALRFFKASNGESLLLLCANLSVDVYFLFSGKYQGLELPGHRANVFTFIWNWPCFSKAFIPTPDKHENAGFSTSFWTTIIVSCFGFPPFQWFSFTFPW